MPTYRRTVECPAEDLELTLAECYGAGAFSIEEQDLPGGRIRLLVYFLEPVSGAEAVDESIDWQSVSEQPWQAIEIGQRLWLAPPWLDEDPPRGRLRLNYLRGQACGTGAHGATQLCLRAMDSYLRAGMRYLDVGAGSGILCVAADLLDADPIVGCDIDHPSVVIAAANSPHEFFTGSVRSVRDESFDFVTANVNATVANYLAADLARITRPGGCVVVSGFKSEEHVALPLPLVEKLEQQGWAALVFRKG
jgi:ribosomal protein L11 methyltransferase